MIPMCDSLKINTVEADIDYTQDLKKTLRCSHPDFEDAENDLPTLAKSISQKLLKRDDFHQHDHKWLNE